MEDSLQKFFVNTKSARILVSLNDPTTDNYASEVSTQVDCTYSHAVRIIQRLEEEGLVDAEKEGRKKMVDLTGDGEEVARKLSDLMHSLQRIDDP